MSRNFKNTLRAFVVFAASAASMHALAATPVSGAITQNATWTAAGSPYVVSGDVTIENGASVAVEPGVTIRMNDGANLRIVAGALSGQGTSEAPIVMTSANDAAGSTARPGDWGRLVFADGTNDANTVLAHWRIRYGSGVVIESASPRIDDTHFEDNAGAALSIDLASSPVGRGLVASGNAINGIAVPDGAIVGDVAWRLKGIPYVVAAGVVDVGLPPFSLEPSSLSVAVGASADLGIALPAAARRDYVVTLDSSNPSVATVAASAVVASGTSQAMATVNGIATGNATITATHAETGLTRWSFVNVVAQPWLALSGAGTPIGAGSTATLTLARSSADGQLTVALASSDIGIATVPGEVTFAAGDSSLTFDVAGIDDGHATITATAPGHVAATIGVNVERRRLVVPELLSMFVGSTASLTVSLSKPAPAGGVAVAIANDRVDVLDVPASVTIAAGKTSAELALTARSQGVATITFNAEGYDSVRTDVSIVAKLEPQLGDGGSRDTLFLPRDMIFTVPVKLSAPAPPGGLTIALSSLAPGVVDIAPAEVTIAAGATVSTGLVTVRGAAAGETLIRLAAVNMAGVEKYQRMRVGGGVRLDLRYERIGVPAGVGHHDNIGLGLRESVTIDLIDAFGAPVALPFAVDARLTTGDASKLAPGPAVTIAAGESYAQAYIEGRAVTAPASPVAVGATSSTQGIGDADATHLGVVVPVVSFSGLGDDVTATDAQGFGFFVNLNARGSLAGTGRAVRLEIVDAVPATVADGIYACHDSTTPITTIDAPGQYCTGSLSVPGRFKIRASMPGFGSVTSPEQIVAIPTYRVDDAAPTLGAGLRASMQLTGHIGERKTRFSEAPRLSSSDPSRVQVPEVAEWSGYSDARVELRGIAPTEPGRPVIVTVSGAFMEALEIPVTVIPTALEFRDLDGVRSPNSGADWFSIRWAGMRDQIADVDHVVDVALAPGATAGVLPNPPIFNGGDALAGIVLPAGWQGVRANLHVATPLAHGTYQLVATLDGSSTVTSPPQTVGVGALWLHAQDVADDLDGERFLPLGERAATTVTVSLVATRGSDSPMTATHPLSVSLVSRAPDWVSVPASVTIPQGESSATFEVRGLTTTDGAVQIDAYFGGGTEPAATLPASVFPVGIELAPMSRRLVDDASRAVPLRAILNYPCRIPTRAPSAAEHKDYFACTATPVFFERRPLRVEIVDETSPSAVAGFVLDGTLHRAAIDLAIDAGASQATVVVAAPDRAGSYRLRATLAGAAPVDVASTIVGALALSAPVGSAGRLPVAPGMVLVERLSVDVVGGGEIYWSDDIVLPEPIEVALACADATICTATPSVTIPAGPLGHMRLPIRLTGIAPGTTTLTVSSPRLSQAAPIAIESVPAKVEVYISGSGASTDLGVRLGRPRSSQHYVDATQPVVVALTSSNPAVATVPATVTIPAGQSSWHGRVQHTGAAGTFAISATANGFQVGVSAPISVGAGGR